MKKTQILALGLVVCTGLAWTFPPKRSNHQKLLHISPQGAFKQRVIVRFRSEKAMNRLDRKVRSTKRRKFRRFSMMAADLTGKEAAALARHPDVLYIEPDYTYQLLDPVSRGATLQDGEPAVEYQYGLASMGVTETLHEQGYTGKSIKVGVIDSGVASLHPDLEVDGGWNFDLDSIYHGDVVGHGTHVAGIIAAKRNGFGVVGVAPEADLYSLRVCNPLGCSTEAIINSVQWSIDRELDILNLSLGGIRRSSAMEEVMDRAYQAGILIVAAAGNSGRSDDNVLYPAKYDSVVAVSATDSENRIASFSSRGPDVELAAPGVDVYSTLSWPIFHDHVYRSLSGTSMASPHVAGLAALIMEANPGISNVDVRRKLATMSVDLGAAGRDIYYGWGIPQAERDPYQADRHAPAADTGGPYRGIVGAPIRFTGLGTVDLDDNVLSFEWDFGDGSTGRGRGLQHVYQEPGDYPVTLTVQDRDGLQSTAVSTALVGAGVEETLAFDPADTGYVRSPGSVYLGRNLVAGTYARKQYYGIVKFDLPPAEDIQLISAELALTCTVRSPKDEGTITAALLPSNIYRNWPSIAYADIDQANIQTLASPIVMSYMHSRVYDGAEHRFNIPARMLDDFEQQFAHGGVAFRMALDSSLSSNTVSWSNPRLVLRYMSAASTGNMAPVAEAGHDRRAAAGSEVILDGSASYDYEGSELRHRWNQIAGAYVPLTVSSENPAVAGFAAPAHDDVLVFELEVDDEYHTSSDQVTIYLNEAPADIHQLVLTPGRGKAGYVHEYLSDMNFFDKPVILSGIQDWITQGDTDFRTFGVLQFDLHSIPPGAQVVNAFLELTGAWKWVGKPAKFEIQLLEPWVDERWEDLDYASVTGALPLQTLSPPLKEFNLGEDVINRFAIDPEAVEGRRASTDRLTFRIDGPRYSMGNGWMWFTWWSGNRSDTADKAPRLVVEYGALEPLNLPPPGQNRAPLPEITAPAATGEPGSEYRFTFSAIDPDDDLLTLSVDWGDGQTSVQDQVLSGEALDLLHAWQSEGTYTVRLEALDEQGASASAETVFRIQQTQPPPSNQPPAIQILAGESGGFAGAEYILTVSASDADDDRVRFVVDWADGAVDTTGYYTSGAAVTLAHVWQQAGTFAVGVTAEDEQGAYASRLLDVEIQAAESQELVVSDSPSGTWYLGSRSGRHSQAQMFRATGSSIQAASLALVRIGNPANPIRVSIQRTLTSTPLVSSELKPSQVGSTDPDEPEWATVYFPQPLEVNEGSYYYLKLEVLPDSSNYYRVGYDHTDPYPYGWLYLSSSERRDLDMVCSIHFAR